MGRRAMSDVEIDELLVGTILGSMPNASDEQKAKVVVSYFDDTRPRPTRNVWQAFKQARRSVQAATVLVILGWLGQIVVAVYAATQL